MRAPRTQADTDSVLPLNLGKGITIPGLHSPSAKGTVAVPTSRQCYKGETKRCWLEVLGGQDAISKAGLQGDEGMVLGPCQSPGAGPLPVPWCCSTGLGVAAAYLQCQLPGAVPVSLPTWRAAGSGLSGPGGRSHERQLLP